MTVAQEFIKKLQSTTGKEPLLEKFWADYSSNAPMPTFQNVLDKYASYYNNLSDLAAKKLLRDFFWEHIKTIGTPIIEAQPDNKSEVYFLFPRDKLSDSKEKADNKDKSETKKELYLQGDFHGYGSTLKETQELTQLSETDIMYRSNTMDKDALVTYYYVQLEPSNGNKEATHFYGDIAYQPPSFFPVNLSETPSNKPAAKTSAELKAADDLFGNPDNVLVDEFSTYHKIYDGKSSFFCADPDKDLSELGLPVQNKPAPSLGIFFSDVEKKANFSLVSKNNAILEYPDNPADLAKCSRSISVYAPSDDVEIDQVVLISDGRYYQLGNTVERLTNLLSENTVLIFITPEQGIEAEAKAKQVQFEAADSLTGMGVRTVDLKYEPDAYAKFIHEVLLPDLVKRGIKIPDDPSKRVLVGSSLGGTASIYMGMNHPEWFGKVVAQSPSINNRGTLEDIITSGKKAPPPEIYLSCGEYESPEYAKNLNLPFAQELGSRLGIHLNKSHHGHQMEAWSPGLEDALPALGLKLRASQDLNAQQTIGTVSLEDARGIRHEYSTCVNDVKSNGASPSEDENSNTPI